MNIPQLAEFGIHNLNDYINFFEKLLNWVPVEAFDSRMVNCLSLGMRQGLPPARSNRSLKKVSGIATLVENSASAPYQFIQAQGLMHPHR